MMAKYQVGVAEVFFCCIHYPRVFSYSSKILYCVVLGCLLFQGLAYSVTREQQQLVGGVALGGWLAPDKSRYCVSGLGQRRSTSNTVLKGRIHTRMVCRSWGGGFWGFQNENPFNHKLEGRLHHASWWALRHAGLNLRSLPSSP